MNIDVNLACIMTTTKVVVVVVRSQLKFMGRNYAIFLWNHLFLSSNFNDNLSNKHRLPGFFAVHPKPS